MNPIPTLLYLANKTGTHVSRDEFYALKGTLLRKHGTKTGTLFQRIQKACWCQDDPGPPVYCGRCRNTGIYEEIYVEHERWVWGKHEFLIPRNRYYSLPDGAVVTIDGYVDRDHSHSHSEAMLWLLLICGKWRLFWRTLKSSSLCQWTWFPLLNLQRVIFSICHGRWKQRLPRRCWDCNQRRFIKPGRGRCTKCQEEAVRTWEDIPF